MACLGSVLYDPGTLATASTTSLLAMTAFDTTNARITFTAPANGIVLVRLRVASKGNAGSLATTLLGVLDGATVKGRQLPISNRLAISGTSDLLQRESSFLVTGLTPGNSFTWDAAYAVQVVQTTSQFGWGGPNNATGSDAYGALSYEIWDTANLLAGTMYDPAVAVTSNATTTASALTAIDTTNLRLVPTIPASGKVLVRLRTAVTGATTAPSFHLGVLEGATLRGRQAAFQCYVDTGATQCGVFQAEYVVSGLTPGATPNWDASYGVEFGVSSSKIAFGGPNDTTGNDAWGGFAYEIWKA